jgi:hypothetical protein
MRPVAGAIALFAALAACAALVVLGTACTEKTDVEIYVDGFLPESVRFEVEDQGMLDARALDALAKRPDVDGALRLPEGACGGPCRAALVSVYVHNKDDALPPPVIRLQSPAGKPARMPIAFRGGEISKGRIGRIRWLVEMWPEEKSLTATLSSSVFIVDEPRPPNAAATAPPAEAGENNAPPPPG